MKWERVTIFISSTFNDMHAERDYLVKNVFPELREWCEERKIHLVDVDLRWGVREEDSKSKNTVLACFNNIDESRPFFLCFLGQRRGWVPTKGDISKETKDEYPDICENVGNKSVTEMEIEHALLSPMKHIVDGTEELKIPVNHALFYFRKDDYLKSLTKAQEGTYTNKSEKNPDLADKKLKIFKEMIMNDWTYITPYDCKWDPTILSPELPETINQGRLTDFNVEGEHLREVIIEQLKVEIIKEFPDRKEVVYSSDLERDLDQQALFIELNSEGFISREGDFDDLNEYVKNDENGLFVLTAPAGFGKSMLLANFIKRESKKHTGRFFNRFCGISDLNSDTFSLWKTIFNEANIESNMLKNKLSKINKVVFDKVDIESLHTLDDLKDNIEELLEDLAKEKTIILIDAINQLPDGLDMLKWLPKELPENLKIILSMKEDEKISNIIENLKNNENISYSTVKPFKNCEEKKKLIKEYLKKYLKALDDKQIDTICGFKGSANPLYLKILLSELRVFGSFDQLAEEIKQFGKTSKEAFNTVLNRLEHDINSLNIDSKEFVPLLFGLLANARNGLSEEELKSCIHEELTTIEDEKLIQAIHLFIRQVRPFMARRDGRIDYFYDSFKLAAKGRYIDGKIHYNKILAKYFKKQADPENNLTFKGNQLRDFNELLYHLSESNNSELLEKLLSTYAWIKQKMELSEIHNTINDYGYLTETENPYHIKLIKNTLIMSQHILKENKNSLPTQLWGRLKNIENQKIKNFLKEVDYGTEFTWLKPYHYMYTPEGALKLTLKGHEERVMSVCFSPNGKYVASGSGHLLTGEGTLRIWDWEKQEELGKVDTFALESLCFSIEGKYVAYESAHDKSITVWDWKKQIELQIGDISSESFDNNIWIMSSQKQEEVQKLENRNNFVKSACFSPDGKYIASAPYGTIKIWNREKQEEVGKLEGHTGSVNGVCFSPDGKYIASGSDDKSARVWDWKKQEEVGKLEGHTGSVNGVCFSPDGKYIISGSSDDTVKVWDWEKKEKIQKQVYLPYMTCVGHSSEGKYFAYGSGTNIIVCERKQQEELGKLEGHKETVNSLCFSPDGKHIVSVSVKGNIKLWNWEKQEEVQKSKGFKDYNWGQVCFSPDGKYIASGKDDTISVWNWEKQEIVQKLKYYTSEVHSICFSPDGKYIAIGDSAFLDKGYAIKVLDWKKEKKVQQLEGHTDHVQCVCFSIDGEYILSGSKDETVKIWDLKKQILIMSLNTENNISFSAFINNNHQIIAGKSYGPLLCYDIENLNIGISVVTGIQGVNNDISARCSYCGKTFNIPYEKSENNIKCPDCEEEMQCTDFSQESVNKKRFLSSFFRKITQPKKMEVSLPPKYMIRLLVIYLSISILLWLLVIITNMAWYLVILAIISSLFTFGALLELISKLRI